MFKARFIKLPDGRRLSYLEFGDADGHPVFYFHGSPSSYFEPLLIGEEIFRKYNLRIISVNRPGIGNSDFQNNRQFQDWPSDIFFLAKYLSLDKFSVLGNSGGCGYVLACAGKIPDKLFSAVVVSGGWQMNLPEVKRHLKFPYKLFWLVADKLPFLLPFFLNAMKSKPGHSTEKSMAQAKKIMPEPDYKALIQNNRAEVLAKATDEALINRKGVSWDLRMYLKNPGFNFPAIIYPIIFFHGEKDKNIPVDFAGKMIAQLPNAELVAYENEAHLSTLCNHFNEIAACILKDAQTSGKNEKK